MFYNLHGISNNENIILIYLRYYVLDLNSIGKTIYFNNLCFDLQKNKLEKPKMNLIFYKATCSPENIVISTEVEKLLVICLFFCPRIYFQINSLKIAFFFD